MAIGGSSLRPGILRLVLAAPVLLGHAPLAAAEPAAATALAVRGDLVYAGTAGGGLQRSTDGGSTFAPVPEVVCPGGVVRDVSIPVESGDPRRVLVACGNLRDVFSFDGVSWSRLHSSAETYSDICPDRDVGPGRPLIHDDPLAGEEPTRLDGQLICGFISCDAWETVSGGGTYVSAAAVFRCPFTLSRLLAPAAPSSPWLLWTVGTGATTEVFRGVARNRLPGTRGFLFPNWGTYNVERRGTIPDPAVAEVARDRLRPDRLLAAGSRGLWRSTDGGREWDVVLAGATVAVTADSWSEGRAAAAQGRLVLGTRDGGDTWSIAGTLVSEVTALTLDAADATRVVAATASGTIEVVRLLDRLASPEGRPTLVSARFDVDRGAIDVSFAGRSGEATAYRLERRPAGTDPFTPVTEKAAGPSTAGTLSDPAPPLDVALEYRVVARGPGGVEAASEPARACAPTTEPLPPDALVAETRADGSYRLAWHDRSGREDAYLVERLALDFTWRPFVLLPPDTESLALPVSPLVPGFFRVRAVNSRGRSEPPAAVSAGGRAPQGAPVLAGVLRDGARAELTVTVAPGAFEVSAERSIDDGPFVEVSRRDVPPGAQTSTLAIVDADLPPQHDVVYRALAWNAAGAGPYSATLSLATFTTPPGTPSSAGARFEPGTLTLTATWKDTAEREDGFRLLVRGPLQADGVTLGPAPRRSESLPVLYSFPETWYYPTYQRPARFGDQLVSVQAFNSAGAGEASPPVRLRLWPPFERSDPEGGWSRWYPHLLPVVLERFGPSWLLTTEAGEAESDPHQGFVSRHYRVLDAGSGTLLAGSFPTMPNPPRRRVFLNLVDAIRLDHPALPQDGSFLGALYRYSDPKVGAGIQVRVTGPVTVGGREGRAGFAYSSVNVYELVPGRLLVPALGDGPLWRSALGLVNTGHEPGPVTLRVTLVDGDSRSSRTLPDVVLERGATRLLEGVLSPAGTANAFALVERVDGASPFYAYGLLLDGGLPEGTFVPPSDATAASASLALTVPLLLESPALESEFVLVNAGRDPVRLLAEYHEGRPADRLFPAVELSLPALGQLRVPSAIDVLRTLGYPLGVAGQETRSGTVRIRRADGAALLGIHAGVRLSTRDRRFGAFVLAVPGGRGTEGWGGPSPDDLGRTSVWGIRNSAAEGLHAAVVNLGGDPSRVRTEVFRCPIGVDLSCTTNTAPSSSEERNLPPGGLLLLDHPFARGAIDYGHVDFVRLSGPGPLLALGVFIDPVTGDPSVFEGTAPAEW